MSSKMAEIRKEMAGLDRALLEILERRFRLAEEVGRLKAEQGRPVVVRDVEQRVLTRARDAATHCGVSPELMEAIFAAIIRGSVERQHRVGVEMKARGGAKVLILGGAGAMGGWLRRFLENIGHFTTGVDTAWAGLPAGEGCYADLDEVPGLEQYSAIFVSVPLETTAEVLTGLAKRRWPAPLFEIASIKKPLEAPLAALRRAGNTAISLHPMFGPGKNPFEPLTLVHAIGEEEEKERAVILDLLAHPYLELVSVPFDRHDRLMGWVLGLAHLTGILFANALTRSGLHPPELRRVASTTFNRQVDTACSVLEEDPGLYFAIQHLNPFRGEVYASLTSALGELTGAVERGDGDAFAAMLTRAAAMLPEEPTA